MDRAENMKKLKDKYGNKCSICGKALSDSEIVFDHIRPLRMGGSNDFENLRLACSRCHAINRAYNPYNEFELEQYIDKLLQSSSEFRNTQNSVKFGSEQNFIADIATERMVNGKWERLFIEVKSAGSFNSARIHTIIQRLNHLKQSVQDEKFVLLFLGKLTESADLLFRQNNIEIWDKAYLSEHFQEEIKLNPHPIFSEVLSRPRMRAAKATEDILIERMKECRPGKEDWVKYQKLIGDILSHLFCPPLSQPLSERADALEVNRRDFILPNYCEAGFWLFLRENYSADFIVVDAKNHVQPIEKVEVLQMANYLKHYGTGLFGIIISRNGASDSALHTIKEKWIIEQKLIVVLQDNEVEQMLVNKKTGNLPEIIIRQKIEDFRISL